MKKFFIIISFIAFVIFFGGFFIRMSVAKTIQFVVGLPVELDGFSVNLLQGELRVRGLRVYNPVNFEEPLMLSLPELFVNCAISDIFKGVVHIEQIVFNLETFNVVKNKETVLNLSQFKFLKSKKNEVKKTSHQDKKKKSEKMKVVIDKMQLKIGKISFKNYSKKYPSVKDVSLNIDETYENIENLQVLSAIIVQKALRAALIGNITDFELSGIQNMISNSVGDVQNLVIDTAKIVKGLGGGGFSLATKTVADVSGVTKIVGEESLSVVSKTVSGVTGTARDQAIKLGGLVKKMRIQLKE